VNPEVTGSADDETGWASSSAVVARVVREILEIALCTDLRGQLLLDSIVREGGSRAQGLRLAAAVQCAAADLRIVANRLECIQRRARSARRGPRQDGEGTTMFTSDEELGAIHILPP
jgi:hypothetical protein